MKSKPKSNKLRQKAKFASKKKKVKKTFLTLEDKKKCILLFSCHKIYFCHKSSFKNERWAYRNDTKLKFYRESALAAILCWF